MKIVFVSYTYWPPDFGGALIVTLEHLRDLVKRGHDVTVLTAGKPGFAGRENDGGLDVRRSPVVGRQRWARVLQRAFNFLWTVWYLLWAQYDVVHLGAMPGVNRFSNSLVAWIMALIARLKGARTVFVHTLADSEQQALALRGRGGAMLQRYLRAVSDIVAISPALYDALAAEFPGKTHLIMRAVKDDLFRPLADDHRRTVREELGFAPDDVVYVFLGSISHRKGFDVLGKALARLNADQPHFKLLAIGPHTHEENRNIAPADIAEVKAPLDGSPHVRYMGRVNEWPRVAELIGAGDVFVFPSRREGIGQAPMQGMAAELPVIIALLPGVTDQASIEGETGYYVSPGSVDELADAMLKLGTDADLRRQMGAQARVRVMAAFGWQAYLDRWEALYAGTKLPD
jgi:glycosyltransferase involved in cell wall biosynthesis